MNEGIERRIFERIGGDFSGRFKSAISDSSGELRGVNVSGEGILARSENKIPESTPLNFWLSSGETSPMTRNRLGKPVEVSGEVVWQEQDSSGQWQAGVRFYKPNLMSLSRLMENSLTR